MQTLYLNRILCLGALIGLFSVSCKKKTEEVIKEIEKEVIVKDTTRPALRANFDYNRLAAKTPYDSLFLDVNGAKTVDYTEGNHLNLMYTDIATYAATGNNGTAKLDSNLLKNKFANTNYPFTSIPATGVSAGTYTATQLNTSVYQVRNATGVSSNQFTVWKTFQSFFAAIDVASLGINDTAKAGVAGRAYTKPNARTGAVSRYLLNAQGVEMSQMIQKGLMGAFQYDYIANVLLSDLSISSAENHKLVAGKNYTELEHNWDVAFSLFTTNRVYGISVTDSSSTGERYLGSYGREYGNSAFGNDYLKLHPAFLKGRAAIVNNDLVEAKAQATIIKTILEKVIARAGAEYIKKWSTNGDQAAGKHQLSEGLGFIYSLRFCKIHGADAAFSDDLLDELIYSNTDGVWGLTPTKGMLTRDKIVQKFAL